MKTKPKSPKNSPFRLLEQLVRNEVRNQLSRKKGLQLREATPRNDTKTDALGAAFDSDPAMSPDQQNNPFGAPGEEALTGTPDDPAMPPDGDKEEEEMMSGEEEPTDPLEDVVKTAQDMVKQTKDVPTILKTVKNSLQTNQELNSRDVVKKLEDTQDLTLKQVANRLKLFLSVK